MTLYGLGAERAWPTDLVVTKRVKYWPFSLVVTIFCPVYLTGGADTVVLRAIICCVHRELDEAEHHVHSAFTVLPVMLVKGPVAVTTPLCSWLQVSRLLLSGRFSSFLQAARAGQPNVVMYGSSLWNPYPPPNPTWDPPPFLTPTGDHVTGNT